MSTTNNGYRVVVLEVTDVVKRIRPDRPNLYVGVTTRTAQQLAVGLNNGDCQPSWARHNIVRIRADLTSPDTVTLDEAVEQRDTLIRQLRTKGYTVNPDTTDYRTYVTNQNIYDPACGSGGILVAVLNHIRQLQEDTDGK